MDAPVAIPNARLADLFDAGFEAGLLVAARLVMIGGPIEFQDGARPPDRELALRGSNLGDVDMKLVA